MTFVFSGVLFSISHTTLPVCQGPFVDIPLLNRYFYSQPIGRRHLQIVPVILVLTWIWHLIDIGDEK